MIDESDAYENGKKVGRKVLDALCIEDFHEREKRFMEIAEFVWKELGDAKSAYALMEAFRLIESGVDPEEAANIIFQSVFRWH